MLLNARSLNPSASSETRYKLENLKDTICNSDIPAMAVAITETWWRPEFSDAQVGIPGYSVIRSDREGRVGGGCALYLHSSLSPSDQVAFSDNCNSVVAVYIPYSNFIIASVYRAPTSNPLQVIGILEEFIQRHSSGDCPPEVYVLGDFNMPLVNWSNLPTDQNNSLVEFAEKHFLTQLVTEPTRGRNILDIVFTNRVDYVLDVDVTDTQMSDHGLVSCILGVGLKQAKSDCKRAVNGFKALDYHNADFTGACEELDGIDWDELLDSYDMEDGGHAFVQIIIQTVLRVFEKHSKRKVYSSTKKRDPYLKRLKRRQKHLNTRLKLARARCSHQSLIDRLNRKIEKTGDRIKVHLLGLL